MLDDLARTFWAETWTGMGGHSARDVLTVAIEEAGHSGTVGEDGLRIELSHRRWRERARVSSRTFYKCLKRLEAAGIGYRDNGGRKRDKPGGFVLRAGVNQDRTEQGTQPNATPTLQSLYGGGLHLRAPRLRWSSPGYKPSRETISKARRGEIQRLPEPRPAIRRPGKIRGGLADALDELGGSATVAEVCGKLNRNPKRARDLIRRKRPGSKGRDGIAVMFAEAGVLTIDGDRLTLADNWLDALDELRRLGREGEADERQRTRHREDRRDYRAGVEAIRRSHEKRAAEMASGAGSIDDLERVPDPDPELLTMLRDALRRYPDHRGDYPSWWASTLWADGYVKGRPDRAAVRAVEVALYELRRSGAA
jgi:hypothetical protein